MEKIKRSERLALMLLLLSQNPNKLFTLTHLSEQFGAAKSTLSEDVTAIKDLLSRGGLGRLETVPGAAGGVKYLPFLTIEQSREVVEKLCDKLCDPKRILPGGFIYSVDVLTDPTIVRPLGQIVASLFYRNNPDIIVTVESSGVPFAMMVAESLCKPLVIARRDNRIADGSVVSLNYLSTSSKRLQTMSLPRRAVHEGQRALVVDDFIKGGGTVTALWNMMKEFVVTIVGVVALIKSGTHVPRVMHEIKSLLTLESVDEDNEKTTLLPSSWLYK